jgi:3-oxoacyl-(acyl-carrier-protein) synthase
MSEAAAALCLETSAANSTNASQAPTPMSGRTGGALSLERNTTPNSRTRIPAIAISHYALGGDGHHLTAGDPSAQLLRHLINKVTPPGEPVDLIHAHGTGTITNDPIELAALDAAFVNTSPTPCLYSHKSALGHSLGAAGLVSIVLNCLAHRHGTIPPNVRTTHPLPANHIQIHPHTLHRPIRHSLALAAGFGGATAAITLSTYHGHPARA